MNIEDLRKLREQIASGEALVRPESVIVDVIDTAIEAAQHAGKEHAEMEDIPTAIGARIEKAETERDGARARIEKLYRAFVLVRTDKPHWRCRCGAVAMPLTDESPCFCEELYEEDWVRIDPCAKANNRITELEAQVAALREALEMASEAMNHMGDIANSMDIVEEEDNIATDAAFALVDRVLTDTDTATAAEAHDARVREPLETKIAMLEATIEADRSHVADCVTELDKALDARFWLSEGRGSYGWDDDRYRQEFADAARELLARIRPFRVLAGRRDHCPGTTEEVITARTQREQRIRADERREVLREVRGELERMRGPHLNDSLADYVTEMGRHIAALDADAKTGPPTNGLATGAQIDGS